MKILTMSKKGFVRERYVENGESNFPFTIDLPFFFFRRYFNI